ncbi:MAG: dephospho-CoA kinase [Bdellovibrionales bacterium]
MKWIGLTGGMGCGKSTALKVFKNLGFGVASADEVVHSLYQKESVIKEVCKSLGIEVEDFSLSKISEIVFADDKKLEALEGVIHPLVRKEVKEIRKSFEEEGFSLSFYEVPLLFEKQMEDGFDYTVCIGASKPVQLRRIKERNPSWSDQEVKARLKAQLSLEEKKVKADFYIDNSRSLEDLKKSCEGLAKKLN